MPQPEPHVQHFPASNSTVTASAGDERGEWIATVQINPPLNRELIKARMAGIRDRAAATIGNADPDRPNGSRPRIFSTGRETDENGDLTTAYFSTMQTRARPVGRPRLGETGRDFHGEDLPPQPWNVYKFMIWGKEHAAVVWTTNGDRSYRVRLLWLGERTAEDIAVVSPEFPPNVRDAVRSIRPDLPLTHKFGLRKLSPKNLDSYQHFDYLVTP